VKWVFDQPLLTDKQLNTERERHIKPAPRDLLAWLRDHRYLKTTAPEPVSLGGVRGVQFDVTVDKVPSGPSNCEQYAPAHCVMLFPITRTGELIDFVEVSGAPSRYTLLDVGGQPVLITVGAPSNQFEAFAAEADRVLRTFSFG
jgi:hypothetical protein